MPATNDYKAAQSIRAEKPAWHFEWNHWSSVMWTIIQVTSVLDRWLQELIFQLPFLQIINWLWVTQVHTPINWFWLLFFCNFVVEASQKWRKWNITFISILVKYLFTSQALHYIVLILTVYYMSIHQYIHNNCAWETLNWDITTNE